MNLRIHFEVCLSYELPDFLLCGSTKISNRNNSSVGKLLKSKVKKKEERGNRSVEINVSCIKQKGSGWSN